MDLLIFLVDHQGQLVSIDDIIETVWKGKSISCGSIYNCLNELRNALGDDCHNPTYILTVPKRGYCLIAPIVPLSGSMVPSSTFLNFFEYKKP
jgi:DNA-binding winged helix-turn-helix (wHTH) protein